jgi:hypothetical protein
MKKKQLEIHVFISGLHTALKSRQIHDESAGIFLG